MAENSKKNEFFERESIAVIAILAGMLLPALSKARETGKKASCISSMKQYGVIFTSYVGEYNDWYLYTNGTGTGTSRTYNMWGLFLQDLKYVRLKQNTRPGYANWSDQIAMGCPSYERPKNPSFSPTHQFPLQAYLLNAVNVNASSWGEKYGLGGGLWGAWGLKDGCKSSAVRKPSQFTLLAEACSKHSTNKDYGTAKFVSYQYFCTQTYKAAAAMNVGGMGMTQHGNSSNQLRADGSVVSEHFMKAKWYNFQLHLGEKHLYAVYTTTTIQ